MKNLHGFVLLQALGGMLLLSFLCFALLFSRHTLTQQSLHTHARLQLALYAASALRLIEGAIARHELIPSPIPQTFDTSHASILGTIAEPYTLMFNIVALDDNLSCVEILAQAQLPDNLMLHYYDSALLAHGTILRPQMPCAVSRMLP
ncbi:MAG: hypothetical protein K2N70_01495 [Helicobacter sp.]|nr:hypothetical protein [Helicobacter sp.]